MKLLFRILYTFVVCSCALYAYAADSYPTKPIRIIVPFGPGSASDLTARVFGKYLQDHWKQPAVIDNRAGANGIIGTDAIRTSPPDGYTVGFATNSTHAAAPYLFKQLPYKPLEDFEHIGLFGVAGSVALVTPSSPFKSISELVAYAKANPGKVLFGYADTSSQVPSELLKTRSGVEIDGVPYKTLANAMTDLIGGQIHFMFASYPASSGQVRGGKLIPIAVTESDRSNLYPKVPTVSETYPGFEVHGFVALVAPRGTPKDVVTKLNQAMRAALSDPLFREQLLNNGLTPRPMTSEEFKVFLSRESARWKDYIKAAKIEAQ